MARYARTTVLASLPFVVDTWTPRSSASGKPHFLTHAHKDHTDGIEATSVDIYCTDLTRKLLLLRLPEAPHAGPHSEGQGNRFHTLQLEVPLQVTYGGTAFTVTALDANHCPGSAMFLFQGPFGNILHTGDCRFTEQVVRSVREALGRSQQLGWGEEGSGGHAAGGAAAGPSSAMLGGVDESGDGYADGGDGAGGGGGERLDLIYLDCTFADLPLDFPTREEAVRQAEQLVRSWAATTAAAAAVGPAASRLPQRVYLAADMLGQEPLLTLAGSLGGQPLYVPPPERYREYGFDNADVLRERRDALAALQHHPDLAGRLALSDDPASRFHLCGVRDFAQRGTGRASRAGSGSRGAGSSLRRTGSGTGIAAGSSMALSAKLSNSLGEAGAGTALPDPDGDEGAVAASAGRGGTGPCLYIRASTQVFAQQVRAQYSRQDQLLAVRAAHPAPTSAMQERAVHYVLFSQHSSRGELVAALDALRPRAVCPINQDQVGCMAAVVAERAGTERLADVEADIQSRLAWAEPAALPAADAAVVPAIGAGAPRRVARRAAADPDSWDWSEDEEDEEEGHEEHTDEGGRQVPELPGSEDAQLAERAHLHGAQQVPPRPQSAPALAARTGATVVDAVATVTFGHSSAAAGPLGSVTAGGSRQPPGKRPPPPPPAAANAGVPAKGAGVSVGAAGGSGGLRDPSALERRCRLLQRLGYPLRLDGSAGSAAECSSGGGGGPGAGGTFALASAYADALRAAIEAADVGAAEARRLQQQEELGWQAARSGAGISTWRRCATLTCMSNAAAARLQAQGCRCCCDELSLPPTPQVAAGAQQTTRSPPPRVASLSGMLRLHGALADSAQAAATAGVIQKDTRAMAGTGSGSGSGAHGSCRAPAQELPANPSQTRAALPAAALRSPLRQIQPPSSPAAGASKLKLQQEHKQQPGVALAPATDAIAATGTLPRDSRRNTGSPSTAAVPQASCLLALIMSSPASPCPQPSILSPQHRHGMAHQQSWGSRDLPAPSPRRPCDAGSLMPQPGPCASPRGLSASAACSGGGGSGGADGGQQACRSLLSGLVELFTSPGNHGPGSEGRHPWPRSPVALPLQGICPPGQRRHASPELPACGSEPGDEGPVAAGSAGAAAAAAGKQGKTPPPPPKEGIAPVAGKRAVMSPPRAGQEKEEEHSGTRTSKRPRLVRYNLPSMRVDARAGAAAATHVAPPVSNSCYLAALLASSSDEDD